MERIVLHGWSMEKRHMARLGPFVVALLAAACGSSAVDIKSAHDAGQGTARLFEGSPQELWTAGHAVMKWNPVGATTDHEGYFDTDPSDFDAVGVWVEPAKPGQTRVTVVVIDDPNLPGPNEEGVMKDIATALTLERNGQPMEKRP